MAISVRRVTGGTKTLVPYSMVFARIASTCETVDSLSMRCPPYQLSAMLFDQQLTDKQRFGGCGSGSWIMSHILIAALKNINFLYKAAEESLAQCIIGVMRVRSAGLQDPVILQALSSRDSSLGLETSRDSNFKVLVLVWVLNLSSLGLGLGLVTTESWSGSWTVKSWSWSWS
jgi:hypothetical protein